MKKKKIKKEKAMAYAEDNKQDICEKWQLI